MRWLRTILGVSLVFMLFSSVAVAQTITLLEDDLTEPSDAFTQQSGGDIAVFEFGAGGMTVSAIERGTGLYLKPASLSETDALLNASITVTATPGSKKAGVGVFCRRSEANGGYLAVIVGKKYAVFGRDDQDQLVKLGGGKSKEIEPNAPNTIKLECARESSTGFSMILTLSINGEQVLSRLEPSAPNIGTMGLYVEGFDNKRALGTFRDLIVEALPTP